MTIAIVSAGLLSLGACVPATTTKQVVVAAEPKSAAAPLLTSMTQHLRCMDTLFLRHPPSKEIIIFGQVKDESGRMPTDTRQILFSAFGDMTDGSRAFRMQDFDSNVTDRDAADTYFSRTYGDSFRQAKLPTHYIRAAITHYEDTVQEAGASARLSLPSFAGISLPGIEYSKGTAVSLISVEMALVDFRTREAQPNLIARNALAVSRSGSNFGATAQATRKNPSQQVHSEGQYDGVSYSDTSTTVVGGTYLLGGLSIGFNSSEHESVSLALRKLIEIGFMELIGKVLDVPYQTCLPGYVEANIAHVQNQVGPSRFVPQGTSDASALAQLDTPQRLKAYITARPNPEDAYLRGAGFEARENEGKAFQLYQYAAQQSHAGAQFQLGQLHDPQLIRPTSPIPADPREAMYWYKAAKGKGHNLASERVSALRAWVSRKASGGDENARALLREWGQ